MNDKSFGDDCRLLCRCLVHGRMHSRLRLAFDAKLMTQLELQIP